MSNEINAANFLSDTEEVLCQCLPVGVDLDDEQLQTVTRFVQTQCKEYAAIKNAQLEADKVELLSTLIDLKKECDTIHCDDLNWVLTNDLAQSLIQKHAAK